MYPEDRSALIKVALKPDYHLGSLLEMFEYQRFKTTGCNLADHVSRIDGFVLTNLGYGLLCERVCDADGSTALTLRDFINRGATREEKDHITAKLKNLISLFNEANAVFQDAHPRNLVLRIDESGDFNLVVVDGFVGRGDFKNFLRQKFPVFLRMKNKHSLKKLIRSLNRVSHK